MQRPVFRFEKLEVWQLARQLDHRSCPERLRRNGTGRRRDHGLHRSHGFRNSGSGTLPVPSVPPMVGRTVRPPLRGAVSSSEFRVSSRSSELKVECSMFAAPAAPVLRTTISANHRFSGRFPSITRASCERTPEWWHAEPRRTQRKRSLPPSEPSAVSAPRREPMPSPCGFAAPSGIFRISVNQRASAVPPALVAAEPLWVLQPYRYGL